MTAHFVAPGDFASFDGHTWLNCAHQGALPTCAARAAAEAIDWKQRPYELTAERFRDVPAQLRRTLARLVGADETEIVLANSASYGLHLVAAGLRWQGGDEVLVMDTDFPSDILPWLRLEARGVTVRRGHPRGCVFEPDEVASHLGPRTRLLCLTWVHSFSGWSIDLGAIGRLCRERGVAFVVNASQALGARPLDVRAEPVDALVSAGFKWLCGPYGTGFCWLHPGFREQLDAPKAYWLSMLTAEDLSRPLDVQLGANRGIRALDIFGTANFLNFVPWAASLEYLLDRGIANIAEYDQALVSRLLDRLDPDRYAVLSPPAEPRRSTLVLLQHRAAGRTAAAFEALRRAHIHVAVRAGNIRVSPHLFNTPADIDRTAEVLNAVSA